MKPNHCCYCGKYIEGVKYNPYNVTFEFYEIKNVWEEKKACLRCAEDFVKINNQCKGGHWEVREIPPQDGKESDSFIKKQYENVSELDSFCEQ